jgi:hypothetical protein
VRSAYGSQGWEKVAAVGGVEAEEAGAAGVSNCSWGRKIEFDEGIDL